MRVLALRSNSVDPDPAVEKILGTLSERGFSTSVLCWDRSTNHSLNVSEIKHSNNKATQIYRIGIKSLYGNGINNLIPLVKFELRVLVWLIKNRNSFETLHAFDLDTGLIAYVISKLFKKKLVYHVLDYYADSHFFPGHALRKIVKAVENHVINHATAVILCSEQRLQQIRPANPKKLCFIHNSPSLIKKRNVSSTASAKTKIVYVGILSEGRLLPELLKFTSLNPHFELHIGGFGPLENLVSEYNLRYSNVLFYGKLSYEETLNLEQRCDVMTAIYDPKIPNHAYAAPNKFYEALMLGKPLLVAKGTGIDEVVETKNIGLSIDYSFEGLVKGLDFFQNHKELWRDMGKRAQNIYITEYSWEIMESRLLHLYEEIR